jgi:Heparinase II/III-like protein/Heparinase II/III N-terminus
MARLQRTFSRLREVGVKAAAGAIARRSRRRVAGTVRGWRLARRPLRASPEEVEAALGGIGLERALRGPALAALPTVAKFERSLAGLDEEARERLLKRAEAVAEHRFDLLGSGSVELGPEIDWSLDFKSGRKWPRVHRSLIVDFYYDDSDIKVPWELSRFQHLPLLAAAFRLNGERRYLDEMGAQLDGWIETNPVEIGANWCCTMDVAIRAANWVAALAIVAPEAARQPWGERVAESLLMHGRFIRSHLEHSDARTNHYISDVVGLLPVAALFSGGSEGAGWVDWAIAELAAEMEHQVRSDGCDHEASIPYHRLVCELFICGTQAADALRPGSFPNWYHDRLEQMLRFVAAYTRPDGLAPQIGDNDDGRFLPLGEYGAGDFRSHLHLFPQAERSHVPPTRSAGFPAGGYYVMRHGDLYAIVRCGDTGMHGKGGHAHNDQLSFELAFGPHALIEDPGTYTYYTDEELRMRFRSTAFHSTLRIDGGEQNELPPCPRFPMGDRTRAEALEWTVEEDRTVFAGRHHGFALAPYPALHERRLEMNAAEQALFVEDAVLSEHSHRLDWTFPVGRCDEVTVRDGVAVADFGDLRLSIAVRGAELSVEQGLYSPGYGRKEHRRFVVARGSSRPGRHLTRFELRVGKRAASGDYSATSEYA